MTLDGKSFAAGTFFAAMGVFVGLTAIADLDLGTAFRMGPGYFPVLLGGILTLLGIAIAVQSIGQIGEVGRRAPWRAILFICLAPVVFGVTIRGLGLAPATALTAFLSALASPSIGFVRALLVSVGLAVFCVVVFSYGLGLSFRLVGPWVTG